MTGIGLPVVLVPTLSVLFDARTAVIVTSFPNLFSAIRMAVHGSIGEEDLRYFWPLLPLLLVGVFIGNRLLVAINPGSLVIAIGGMLVLFVVLNLLPINLTISPRAGRRLAPIMGLIAGILQGVVAISGPPLAIFFHSLRLPKSRFIGSISLVFVVLGGVQVLALAGSGLYDLEKFALSVSALIPTFVGMQLGVRVHDRLQQRAFNRVLLVVLFVTGVTLLLRAARALP